jgi:hypothetical protein
VHKKLLIQAAACNLALLMRALYGAGKPRAAHDRQVHLIFAILWLDSLLSALWEPARPCHGYPDSHPLLILGRERYLGFVQTPQPIARVARALPGRVLGGRDRPAILRERVSAHSARSNAGTDGTVRLDWRQRTGGWVPSAKRRTGCVLPLPDVSERGTSARSSSHGSELITLK